MRPYQTILFDFDGVLCRGKFYEKTLLPNYSEIYNWIQINIFGDSKLAKDWMKGRVSSRNINKLIAEHTNIREDTLNKLYEQSVYLMEPDEIVEWRWFSLNSLPSPLFFPSAKMIENYRSKAFYLSQNR
ncbi:MAG: hypothetical protein A3G52_03325 [Candidatus Taylorbacteria bacterium RIFCSPLOWO2_12_FULL_43_20]|uniref:Uncharacterized protein n=1 Tax=Candidatus Taylorbacteria bacterium RIFCSPLOWO2_12_FULL_43_20 TaxID=1802332 RepID=A0A1G2P393_9BACT|nr:MAG: hypothetical protein A2825_00090 [Candidatus Taylorbacteria bacterium RIFCSPHIGHO2_01_FULL_43_120]OHA23339.1 MAG: hypothetical protein A3B98_00905 [Candidatus Taylorbacteria bacterium RIFCSPHIGHO2_02_FULL_43_55]OHA29569.1 MAG: hypothetical protein A3E92_00610 [Candidatus Taylorbacteria bacterium RIFCSPHIGHO2_12_FULL_42_34]OHA31225.1 MAG: hypothetical protein A3B09_03510 [Candidatus Taylorbacteria bacterium RIFCSPLOWO2_01_FULL_43_83]OHA38726.1 MAG: hypothetical protein A3H58_02740 [Candi